VVWVYKLTNSRLLMQSRHENLATEAIISNLVYRRQVLIFGISRSNNAPSLQRNKSELPDERDALVERLREFIRFGYVTGSEIASRRGVTDRPVYAWLQGEARPADRLTLFLVGQVRQNGKR
jgi:hypothetical protein